MRTYREFYHLAEAVKKVSRFQYGIPKIPLSDDKGVEWGWVNPKGKVYQHEPSDRWHGAMLSRLRGSDDYDNAFEDGWVRWAYNPGHETGVIEFGLSGRETAAKFAADRFKTMDVWISLASEADWIADSGSDAARFIRTSDVWKKYADRAAEYSKY